MAKDNFDLRKFLVENKMTVDSRGNEIRRHFLTESLEEKQNKRKPFRFDINMPAGINENEDIDECGDSCPTYIDIMTAPEYAGPEYDELRQEIDTIMGWGEDTIGQHDALYSGGREQAIENAIRDYMSALEETKRGSFVDPEDLEERCGLEEGRTLDDKIQAAFDRLGIDRESFNKFAQQVLGKVHGRVPSMLSIVAKAYNLTDKQVRSLVDKQLTNWTRTGFGATGRDLGRKGNHGVSYADTDSYTGQALEEDFADIANAAAREQERYADTDSEEEPATADTFGGLGSTSYEAPEDYDLKGADESSIRRSYTSLKNQGIGDERAMSILAKSYDIPEDTVRAIFRTELGNLGQKAVQVDEPKDRVSTFRMPKRSSAAEKAAAADMRGEFDDDAEDEREFAKPGETDPDEDEEGAEISSGEAATGTVNIPVDGKDMSLTIPENFAMDETEASLVKRLQGYKRPAVAIPYLQRALNAAQKAASSVGSGKIYMYLCSDGAYHTYGSKVKLGDTIPVEKRNGNVIDTKITQFVAAIDCSGAPATVSRRQAADAAKTDAQAGTATSGYGSMELSDNEIQSYVNSKAWNAKSIEQKLRDEYFPWSKEASEYMDDDEIASAKAELKNETPVDPESEWAKAFVGRK